MDERTPCDQMAALAGAVEHLMPLCSDCQLDVLAALLGATLLSLPREARAAAHLKFETAMTAGMTAVLLQRKADPIGAPAGHA